MFGRNTPYIVATVVGLFLIAVYLTLRTDDALLLFVGAGFALFGLAAGTLSEFAIGPEGFIAKFLHDVADALPTTGPTLGLKGELEAKLIRGKQPPSAEEVAKFLASTITASIASAAPAAQSDAHARYIPPKDGDPS